MATYIEMPKLADTMTEGTLLKWKKKEGDKVRVGDVIAEVETDKATMEMEAFDDGILHRFLVKEGEKVPIGSRLALLLAKGEQPPADDGASDAEGHSLRPRRRPLQSPAPSKKAAESGSSASTPSARPAASVTSASPSGDRVKISPLARKIAREKGLDVATLRGSGPGGRVIARDVEAGKPSGKASAGQAAPPQAGLPPVPVMPAGPNDTRIPLSGMRRIIAERLLISKTQLPHFYLNIEVDAAPLLKLRAELNASSEAAGGPSSPINDFVLKAVISGRGQGPGRERQFCRRRHHPIRCSQSRGRRGRGRGRACHPGDSRRARKRASARSVRP